MNGGSQVCCPALNFYEYLNYTAARIDAEK